MKKYINYALAAGVITAGVFGLTSCEKIVNKLETIYVQGSEQEKDIIEAVIKDYNENNNNNYTAEYIGAGEAEALEMLGNGAAQKDEAPALFLCVDDQIPALRAEDIVLEITGSVKEDVVANNTPNAVKGASSIDNKLWGFPISNDNGYFLWYNSAALSDVSSLEVILDVCRQNNKKFYIDIANGWYANTFIMSPDACGTSSLYWEKDSDFNVVYKSTWDSEKGVKVSEYIESLLKGAYEEGILAVGADSNFTGGFKDNTVIAGVSGTWLEDTLRDNLGVNGTLAASKLPSYHIDGQAYQMASFAGSKLYCVNKYKSEEVQKIAIELAKLITNEEAQLKRYEIRKIVPCNNAALKNERFTSKLTLGTIAISQQSPYTCNQSKTAEGRYWDIGKVIGQAYYTGEKKDDDGNDLSWQEFLTYEMNKLRNPAVNSTPVENPDNTENQDTIVAEAKDSVIIHYYREDKNYSNWSLWLWNIGDGKQYEFQVKNGDYAIAVYPISTWTDVSTNGLKLIVKGTNSWDKDEYQEDRGINGSDLVLDANGNYHIYVYSGVETLYTSPQN